MYINIGHKKDNIETSPLTACALLSLTLNLRHYYTPILLNVTVQIQWSNSVWFLEGK